MKCYFHADRDAVGICSACHRGVCGECGVDLQRGLGCKGRCEQEVRRLLDLRDFSFAQPHRTEAVMRTSSGAQLRSALFLIILGGIMGGYGLYDRRMSFLLWLGVAEFLFGLWALVRFLTRPTPRGDQFRICPKCGYNVSGNTTGRCPECNFQV